MKILSLCLLLGFFDIMDGDVARYTNSTSNLGAFLDLTLDRTVECFFIISWIIATLNEFQYNDFIRSGAFGGLIFLSIAIYNLSTFFTAAILMPNNSKKSMHYDVGLLERSETFILFVLLILNLNIYGLYFLWIFNFLMLLTALERTRRIILYYKIKSC